MSECTANPKESSPVKIRESSTQQTGQTARNPKWLALFRLARPADWVKNAFVLAPVPFAVKAGSQLEVVPFLLGLLGFSLITSGIYTLNDLRDAHTDRLHPRKRRRPVASGEVSPTEALTQALVLLLAGTAISLLAQKPYVLLIVVVYAAASVGYCLGLKHTALVDVFVLSSGYLLRVLLGCALLAAPPSSWLLLCTSSLALFLGFVKRRADLLAGLDSSHRPSLAGYSQAFLDQAIVLTAGMSLVSYAIYSIDSGVLIPGREMASMPFVAFGVLNYLRLADVKRLGGSPVDVALKSRSSQIVALGWIVAVTWSLGLW